MRVACGVAGVVAGLVLGMGCSDGARKPPPPPAGKAAVVDATELAKRVGTELALANAAAEAHADSVESKLRSVHPLSGSERRALTRDANREQIAKAKEELGL